MSHDLRPNKERDIGLTWDPDYTEVLKKSNLKVIDKEVFPLHIHIIIL